MDWHQKRIVDGHNNWKASKKRKEFVCCWWQLHADVQELCKEEMGIWSFFFSRVEWWKNNNQTHLSKCMNKLLNVLSSSCHVHLLAFSSDLFPQTLKSETVCTCCCFPPSNKYPLNLFLSLCVHFPSFQDALFLFCNKHETKTLPQTLSKTLKKETEDKIFHKP